jgi:hypothetical protein
MAQSHTASQTISEMREFASFTRFEQFFIARSLDLVLERHGEGRGAHASARGSQCNGYRNLRAQRQGLRQNASDEALRRFFGALVDVSAQDFARGHLSSFGAYRFLYERLLGAAARPYLPASFCAAAALPTIEPEKRRQLLRSVDESIVTTPGWSSRAPAFFPCQLAEEPA